MLLHSKNCRGNYKFSAILIHLALRNIKLVEHTFQSINLKYVSQHDTIPLIPTFNYPIPNRLPFYNLI